MAALLARKKCPWTCATVARVTGRQAIERRIEALIAQLDTMDGDTDAEDDGTAEPSLGWSLTYAHGANHDHEGTSPEWCGPVMQRRRAR